MKFLMNHFFICFLVSWIFNGCNSNQSYLMQTKKIKDNERSIREEKRLYEKNKNYITNGFIKKIDKKYDKQINIIDLIKQFLCINYDYIDNIRKKTKAIFNLDKKDNEDFLSFSDLIETNILCLKSYFINDDKMLELINDSSYLIDFPTYLLPLEPKIQLINQYKIKFDKNIFLFLIENEVFTKSFFNINSKDNEKYDLITFLDNWKNIHITLMFKRNINNFLKFKNYLKTIKYFLDKGFLDNTKLDDPRNNNDIFNYYNFIKIINTDILDSLTLSKFNLLNQDLLDFKNKTYEIFLIKKLFDNDLNKIEKYIKKHKDITSFIEPKYKQTSLFEAIKKNEYNIIELLLIHGSNIDHQDFNLITPLILAVNKKNLNSIKILIKYKPDLSLKNSKNLTALEIANKKSYYNIIDLLTKL